MSRGIGRVQTDILRVLERFDGPLDTSQMLLHGPNRTGIKATQRALRGLLKRGLIESFGRNSFGRMQWRKLGSRARDIANVIAEIEAAEAAGDKAAGMRMQRKMFIAMLDHTSTRDAAQCLGISKSTVSRDRTKG